MGAECSVERQITYNDYEKDRILSHTISDTLAISDVLNFKNYKEYENKLKVFKAKVGDLIKKISSLNDFIKLNNKGQMITRIKDSYFKNKSLWSIEKLYDMMVKVMHKINSVYNNSFCFPKFELEKVTYDLITRYLAYEACSEAEPDEEEGNFVVTRVIKRLNYFTDEFPFKLKNLEKIVKSEKVIAFGYDNCYRVTFYIRPYFNVPSVYSGGVDDSLSKWQFQKLDYILFIFFVIEFIIPSLKSNYGFSQEFNIFVDFNNKVIDLELINILLHYCGLMYPLLLNKLYITNYVKQESSINNVYVSQVGKEDKFGSVVFCEESFKMTILQKFPSNCVPIEYGGYARLDVNPTSKVFLIDELAEYILSNIIIREI